MINFPAVDRWSGQLLKNVQKIIGVEQDGKYGPNTANALTKYLNENKGPPSWLPSFAIDVSHHNGVLSLEWFQNKKEEGYELCYVKITEGQTYQDKYAIQNIKWAFTAGFKVGIYHFCRPDGSDSIKLLKDANLEAVNFLKSSDSVKEFLTLPACLDIESRGDKDPAIKVIEPLTGSALIEWSNDWFKNIDSLTSKCILYTGKSFFLQYLKSLPNDRDLWIAAYHSEIDLDLNGRTWKMWQYNIDNHLDHSIVDPEFFRGLK